MPKIKPGLEYIITERTGETVKRHTAKAVKIYSHMVVFETPGGWREALTWWEIERRVL